jgi:polysaccharide export outer membrane protein
MAIQLSAQILGQQWTASDQQEPSNSFVLFQQERYPICTPADYGDPNANCVPPSVKRPGPLFSGPIEQGSSATPSLDGFSISPSMSNYSVQPEPYRARSPHYFTEPPTEFQRYVAEFVGDVLPIFGASLFDQVPATFAPVDQVPVPPDYRIAAGDEVQLSLWGELNFSRKLLVDRTGMVMLPEVGPVSLAGLTQEQAASVFKSAISHVYKNFDLTVNLARLHSIQIFVVGEARRPGTYTVSSFSTLINAIFASGGPNARGSMRNIQLKRANRIIRNFDLYDLLVRGDKSTDAQLTPGDVIFIPPAGPRVAVAGSVEHPAIYELKDRATLRDALRLASGLSPIAAGQQAILERIAVDASLEIQRIPLTNNGLTTQLRNGDIIRLLPVVPRFANAVILRGNVADPGRFPWFSGMRISDLIPDKNVLLTRDYWKERNNITRPQQPAGSPLSPDSPGQDRPASEQTTGPAIAAQSNSAQSVTTSAQQTNFQTVLYRDQVRNSQGDTSLGAATGIDSVPPVRNFLPRNIVQPLVPEINWEYATIERTDTETLSTRIIPFNLGKLVLKHDASQDLLLQPGDIITIFSKADFAVPRSEQPKQVRLEGEIRMAGVYTVLPNETLRQLVARAGGLTSNAYLYGAQFTRESARREQQKRHDDFVAELEREMTESAANLSSRVISPQQAATAQTSVASQRDLIERLRKIPIDGRIVLDLAPNSKGVDSLPDLPLENGDRLYVPSRPSTVNVIGAVFEQASFLHEEDLRAGDYLRKAGGPTRSADRSHMFIIRADGSVVSRSVTPVLFARSFENLHMYPGDTLVVPTYINKSTFARNLMDWSQILSNLALGAAAINVLH